MAGLWSPRQPSDSDSDSDCFHPQATSESEEACERLRFPMDLPTKLSLGVPVYPLPPGKILNVQLTVAAAAAAADSLSRASELTDSLLSA